MKLPALSNRADLSPLLYVCVWWHRLQRTVFRSGHFNVTQLKCVTFLTIWYGSPCVKHSALIANLAKRTTIVQKSENIWSFFFPTFFFELSRNRCQAEIQSHAPCAVSHRQRLASTITWVLISVWSRHQGGKQTHSTSVYVDLLRRYHFILHLLPQALLISQVVSALKITWQKRHSSLFLSTLNRNQYQQPDTLFWLKPGPETMKWLINWGCIYAVRGTTMLTRRSLGLGKFGITHS